MNILQKHELFEIEVLEVLKNRKLLESLVFGGGTMLRLCFDHKRYSADLDFWFIKKESPEDYFQKIKQVISSYYDLCDAQIKFYTILLELRSGTYPKRLKIEIRKELKNIDFQERIAFSRYSTKQVILRVHTLEQTIKNKINALLDRNEIRDGFDIEFLLRRGVPFPDIDSDTKLHLIQKIKQYKENDFKVKLGSMLESEEREYYIKNRFSFLLEKLTAL